MSTTRYRIKEIFYTLQGEGAQAGRPAVFCRFSKCNLWNGRESGRAEAICDFCDTDFIGTDGQLGGIYSAAELVEIVIGLWPHYGSKNEGTPYIVCTGGEPLLQLDRELIDLLHHARFEVAVETNGTLPAPDGLDWICVSPKANAPVVLGKCHELKLVYPQPLAMPEQFAHIDAEHYYLQPMADFRSELIGTDRSEHNLSASTTAQTLAYCLANPKWKLSLQTHKLLGID